MEHNQSNFWTVLETDLDKCKPKNIWNIKSKWKQNLGDGLAKLGGRNLWSDNKKIWGLFDQILVTDLPIIKVRIDQDGLIWERIGWQPCQYIRHTLFSNEGQTMINKNKYSYCTWHYPNNHYNYPWFKKKSIILKINSTET